jgi:superfamily II DNA or RNA helicase
LKINISNSITIRDPTPAVFDYCRRELVIANPQYYKLEKMGKWNGNEPREVYLYDVLGPHDLKMPFGALQDLWRLHPHGADYSLDLAFDAPAQYNSRIQLRDYQAPAIQAVQKQKNGIIIMPCGSGKTETGLEVIAQLGQRALWVTHTIDLLNQSRSRAADKLGLMGDEIGEITDGKVSIGTHITFATVQTLSRWRALDDNRYTWPVVIVDEAHRCCISAKSIGMFQRCVSALAARYKLGLTATAHRSDGLIKGMYALLGGVVYEVGREAVADKTVPVEIRFRATQYDYSEDCLDADGTIIFGKMQEDIALDHERNQMIADDLLQNTAHSNLILADRIFHLNMLRDMLPTDVKATVIDGKTPKPKREQAIKDMRDGTLNYLFATYNLAKEGLDIPRLDRLYLAAPRRDYAVIVQSVGRIARQAPGKKDAIVYDYVDPVGVCKKMHRERQKHYRSAGYKTNMVVV